MEFVNSSATSWIIFLMSFSESLGLSENFKYDTGRGLCLATGLVGVGTWFTFAELVVAHGTLLSFFLPSIFTTLKTQVINREIIVRKVVYLAGDYCAFHSDLIIASSKIKA